ncbi:MAG: hypothetical protein ACLQU3_13215 [Limisphaerales bacterium]
MVLALACSIGLHWGFLQSFAWATMLVDNLATTSFSAALQHTFDGKHPCALCKAVAEGKKAKKKSDTLLSLKKFEVRERHWAFSQPLAFENEEQV